MNLHMVMKPGKEGVNLSVASLSIFGDVYIVSGSMPAPVSLTHTMDCPSKLS